VGRRIALLIGNQVFLKESGLQSLRGPTNDVEALAEVLGNPELGSFEVRKLLDKPNYEVFSGHCRYSWLGQHGRLRVALLLWPWQNQCFG
jgi:hypothetical protein